MMAVTTEGPRLFVEGRDDEFAIFHLVRRHVLEAETRSLPEIEESGSKKRVLENIEAAIPAGTDQTLGFVLDADRSLKSTWQAAVSRLRTVGVRTPDQIPEEGFIGRADPYRTRVGVWIMPDNRREGELEDFLQDLVDEENVLFPHAQEATEGARSLGAGFPDQKTGKAVLHTWLAWQENPGRPYGTAIASGYLRHDREAAIAFVSWFRQLFALEG